MKEYVANVITSVFPFGVITKGEFLTKEQTDILGEEILADMVRRGVITEIGDEADTVNAANGTPGEAPTSSKASETGAEAPPEAPGGDTGEDDDEDEGAELEPDTMDDVVDEAEEANAEDAQKPKKNSGGRKAK